MRLIALAVTGLTKVVAWLARWLAQTHLFLYGILPALLPPDDLATLMRRYYERSYAQAGSSIPLTAYSWSLEPWEERILAQYMARSGTVLILGAGLGRESLAIAQRGFRVIALDIAHGGLVIGARQAASLNLSVTFVHADFLALPVRPASVMYILLPGVMYSAVPGRARRQAWIRRLRDRLLPGGKLILNFLIAREPESDLRRYVQACQRMILRWPGSNRDCQPGDTCTNGHFMHTFQDEEELRGELTGAGAEVIELNWTEGFAVLS